MKHKTMKERFLDGEFLDFVPTNDPKAFYQKINVHTNLVKRMDRFKKENKIDSKDPKYSSLVIDILESVIDMRYGGEVKYVMGALEYDNHTAPFSLHIFPSNSEDKYTPELKSKLSEDVGHRAADMTYENNFMKDHTKSAMTIDEFIKTFEAIHHMLDGFSNPRDINGERLLQKLSIGINGVFVEMRVSMFNENYTNPDTFGAMFQPFP